MCDCADNDDDCWNQFLIVFGAKHAGFPCLCKTRGRACGESSLDPKSCAPANTAIVCAFAAMMVCYVFGGCLFLLLVSENDAFCCCSSALAGQRNCGHFTCHFHDSIGNYPLLKWRAQMNDIEAGELET